MNENNTWVLSELLLADVSRIEKCYKYICDIPTQNTIFKSIIETFQAYKESNIPLNESGFKLNIRELSENGKEDKAVIDEFFRHYNEDKGFSDVLSDITLYNTLCTVLNDIFIEKYRLEFDHNKQQKISEMHLNTISELKLLFFHEPIVNNLSYFETGLFEKALLEYQEKSTIKTGFDKLNSELGGLFPGLYVIGAMPSIGKSTFVLQICDNIASAKNNVIFFSLEQSRLELISKSLVRLMTEKEKNKSEDFLEKSSKLAFQKIPSAIELRTGKLDEQGKEYLKTAIEEYKTNIAKYVTIDDNNFTADVNYIRAAIKSYMSGTNQKPVIVIDYLQVLKPVTQHHEIRETIDYNIQELKKIAVDYSIPVIVISSFNRTKYDDTISFSSFKESGGIEYTADVLLGLELVKDEENAKVKNKTQVTAAERNELMKKPKRKIKLHCLKNRNGNTFDINYSYYPRYETFIEDKKQNGLIK